MLMRQLLCRFGGQENDRKADKSFRPDVDKNIHTIGIKKQGHRRAKNIKSISFHFDAKVIKKGNL